MLFRSPGQAVKPGAKEKTHHSMTDATMAEIKAELERQGIHAVNYGVVGAKNRDEVQAIMAFAKKMGLYAVCTESTEQIAHWEEAAKQYDVKVSFHEHGGTMDRPKYKVWHPLYILGVVESRDPRVGACADVGSRVAQKPLSGPEKAALQVNGGPGEQRIQIGQQRPEHAEVGETIDGRVVAECMDETSRHTGTEGQREGVGRANRLDGRREVVDVGHDANLLSVLRPL